MSLLSLVYAPGATVPPLGAALSGSGKKKIMPCFSSPA